VIDFTANRKSSK